MRSHPAVLRARPRLRLVLAIAAAFALAALVGGWARFLRVSDLEEDLVREANETLGAPHPRPLHVRAAAPGSLAEALARHLPPLEREARRWTGRGPEAAELCLDGLALGRDAAVADALVRRGLLGRDEAARLRDLELVPGPGGALTLRLVLPALEEGGERETVALRLDP